MKLAPLAMLPLIALTTAVPLSAQTKPRTTAPAQTGAPTTATVTVTDQSGAPIADVRVDLTGSLDRSGSTQSNGTVRFDSMRPGIYRLRFEKEGFVTLGTRGRGTCRAAAAGPVGRAHRRAPSASSAARTSTPPEKTAAMPPPGKSLSLNVPDFIERNFITNNQPQKVTPVSCSGWSSTVLWQIREPWDNRQHANQDLTIYVVGGEGTVRLDGRDVPLQAGSFVQVPRGSTYSLSRRGRNPVLISLATLVGEPCQ